MCFFIAYAMICAFRFTVFHFSVVLSNVKCCVCADVHKAQSPQTNDNAFFFISYGV